MNVGLKRILPGKPVLDAVASSPNLRCPALLPGKARLKSPAHPLSLPSNGQTTPGPPLSTSPPQKKRHRSGNKARRTPVFPDACPPERPVCPPLRPAVSTAPPALSCPRQVVRTPKDASAPPFLPFSAKNLRKVRIFLLPNAAPSYTTSFVVPR